MSVTETLIDAAGRVTNSVRSVWFNGSPDPAYAPLATRTEYPYGSDHYRVTTSPLGVQTVTRKSYGSNCEIEETVSVGVTNRTTVYWGGATVEEKYWDGKWTRSTRSTDHDAAGYRVETVITESSDYPTVTNSVTTYDFLGRVVFVTTPLGVTSNFYSGASDRVARMSRTGSPDTLYVYDALGNVIETVTDINGNGLSDPDDEIDQKAEWYEDDDFGYASGYVFWHCKASIRRETGNLTPTTHQGKRFRGLAHRIIPWNSDMAPVADWRNY